MTVHPASVFVTKTVAVEEPCSAIVRAWPGPSVRTHFTRLEGELDSRFEVARERGSAAARAYRALRHRLYAQGDPRVIAITSVAAGEGKTRTAVNLATVLTEEAQTRVLLVEANTYRPVLASLFRTDHPADMGYRLRGERGSREPWPVLTFDGVFTFHAAVMPQKHGPSTLDRPLYSELIEAMRQEYDYIVVDTPPLEKSADGSLAASLADGVILSARAASTSSRALKKAAENLLPARVNGVVLHDVSAREAACA